MQIEVLEKILAEAKKQGLKTIEVNNFGFLPTRQSLGSAYASETLNDPVTFVRLNKTLSGVLVFVLTNATRKL